MKNVKRFYLIALLAIPILQAGDTLAQSPPAKLPQQQQASSNPVTGGGTTGQISKWLGVSGSTTFVLGNSVITEDKFGKIGIGTTLPSSKLSVAGTIESFDGGFKFPDGTVQTTAGLSSIFRNATLIGNGTAGSPLGVAVPLRLSGAVTEPGAVLSVANTTANSSDAGDGIHVIGGSGVAAGGTGLVAQGGGANNTGGDGVRATGSSGASFGGSGVLAEGGDVDDGGQAGTGVRAFGGSNDIARGGPGITGAGGFSQSDKGGEGLLAFGGFSDSGEGGDAIVASAGTGTAGNGLAGSFFGDVEVQGSFSVVGTKNFKIDHPLDPENKYLYHAAIESSEVLNIYSGNITTDVNGDAGITLPDWFQAINSDLRYQLTVVGTFAQAIVAEEVRDNHFSIKTNAPNVKVSWQVTGVRSDSAMRKHPFKAVEVKPERERGHYLAPESFNQPEEKSVQWARYPELMKKTKERREQLRLKQQNPAR